MERKKRKRLQRTEQWWRHKNSIFKVNKLKNNKLLEKEEVQPTYIGQKMKRIGQKVINNTHGFTADLERDIWQNIGIQVSKMRTNEYFQR